MYGVLPLDLSTEDSSSRCVGYTSVAKGELISSSWKQAAASPDAIYSITSRLNDSVSWRSNLEASFLSIVQGTESELLFPFQMLSWADRSDGELDVSV